MKIALLSNINYNFVIRILSRELDVYQSEGYGNEIGVLLDKSSSYHAFNPEIVFLLEDFAELIGHNFEPTAAEGAVKQWFSLFEANIDENKTYYVSDAVLICDECAVFADRLLKSRLENLWNNALADLILRLKNVRIFPLASMLCSLGLNNAVSKKTWYMGKILLSPQAQNAVADEIRHLVDVNTRTAKKVLVLDLDNTLWGGLAGENDRNPVVLSDDHLGLVYKNAQRVIKQIKEQGTILCIASKNNEDDALEIIENHPHQILRKSDFAALKINWQSKDLNIRELAEELNLGLDSFVFVDDSRAERELVKHALPEVSVSDFPENIEKLPEFFSQIYRKYFEKPSLTAEDFSKTEQYTSNAKRNSLKSSAASFDEYLEQLDIKITRLNPDEHKDRIFQLVNKTNQFNLTTRRYSESQMWDVFSDKSSRIYAYGVSDSFGDNGLTAVVMVNIQEGKLATISDFVMSCRIMGRRIENAVLDDVESDLQKAGCDEIEGIYVPTKKNLPVRELYASLGYKAVSSDAEKSVYRLKLVERPIRKYFAKIIYEEN